jgi:protein ImuA
MRITSVPDPALLTTPPLRRWGFGVAALDTVLAGGLAYGRVHEVFAGEAEDAASAAGFALAMASGMADERPLLWLRSRRTVATNGVLQANGWAEMGVEPGQALFAVLPDTMALLKATVDALRSGALGAVVAETRGRMPELDLTASRRLTLAAEKTGVPLFLLQVDANPVASAAQTRWQVSAAPSQALPGNAPGLPVFDIALLRQKSGPCGLQWRLEWDRDQRIFRNTALPGVVVPVPQHRPAADTGIRRAA